MKLKKDLNKYYITTKRDFKAIPVSHDTIDTCFKFAYEMSFGDGFHRKQRSGGQDYRNRIEVFNNTLQGKVAEMSLHKLFINNNLKCQDIDFSISGKGVWDDVDLVYKDNHINVKSAAYFSNLLLLETKDYDLEGNYIPNKVDKKSVVAYDYFVLVRIKPNINSLEYMHTTKQFLKSKVTSMKWYYDVAGWCSHKTLRYIIENKYIIPQKALLNGKVKMDAENYYLQSGSLKEIESLIDIFKFEK